MALLLTVHWLTIMLRQPQSGVCVRASQSRLCGTVRTALLCRLLSLIHTLRQRSTTAACSVVFLHHDTDTAIEVQIAHRSAWCCPAVPRRDHQVLLTIEINALP